MSNKEKSPNILPFLAHLSDSIVAPKIRQGEQLKIILASDEFTQFFEQGKALGLNQSQIITVLMHRCGIKTEINTASPSVSPQTPANPPSSLAHS